MNKQPGTDGNTFADVLEDHALRMAVSAGSGINVDPLLLSVARETAQELLVDYLEHVRLNAAARRILERIGGTVIN